MVLTEHHPVNFIRGPGRATERLNAMIHPTIFASLQELVAAAATVLEEAIVASGPRAVMLSGGKTPQPVYEAIAARQEGKKRVIVFNLSGHGMLDLSSYDAYLAGNLKDEK